MKKSDSSKAPPNSLGVIDQALGRLQKFADDFGRKRAQEADSLEELLAELERIRVGEMENGRD